MSLSLSMVVCNEAPHMRACLSDIRPYVDEIVVIVQPSDDHTLALAYELADRVIEHPAYGFSEPSRAAALAACTGDWLLVLDADERLSAFGKANIRGWTESTDTDYYYLRRLTKLDDGHVLEDMAHPRLYRRGCVISPAVLHAMCLPTEGARVRRIIESVIIEHYKTTAEQHHDDLRYAALQKKKE